MGRLYWSVSPLPSASDLSALRDELARAFPSEENRSYLEDLAKESAPVAVTAARLGALSLLPPLLRRCGVDPAALILQRDAHGRPFLRSCADGHIPCDFNLSHSYSHGFCAVLTGGGRVGVDIEEPIPSRRALKLIRRYCTPGELRLLEPFSEEDQALAFTRIWTIREALGKQAGQGMPLRYDASEIPDGIQVLTREISETGTRLALCVPLHTELEVPF